MEKHEQRQYGAKEAKEETCCESVQSLLVGESARAIEIVHESEVLLLLQHKLIVSIHTHQHPELPDRSANPIHYQTERKQNTDLSSRCLCCETACVRARACESVRERESSEEAAFNVTEDRHRSTAQINIY